MIRFLLMVLLSGSLLSCAGKKGPTHAETRPGETQREATPARQASDASVEEGKKLLDQGILDRAADSFQEAVTIDPTNGVGFYYLTLVNFKQGKYDDAKALLDNARSLLSHRPEWSEPLDQLTRDLMGFPSPPDVR